MATVSRNSRWLRVRGGKPTSNSPCLLACQKAVSLWCYKPYDDDDESDFRKWFSILEFSFFFPKRKSAWKPCSTIMFFFQSWQQQQIQKWLHIQMLTTWRPRLAKRWKRCFSKYVGMFAHVLCTRGRAELHLRPQQNDLFYFSFVV